MFLVFANKKNLVLWLHVTIDNVQFIGSIFLVLESEPAGHWYFDEQQLKVGQE